MTTQEEIQWDSQSGVSFEQRERTAMNRPKTNAEAEARGVDGLGVPMGPTRLGEPTNDSGQRGTGQSSKGMLAKIQQMESGDIADQVGLHDFSEAGRSLCMNLALLIELTSGQLKADAKKMARDNSDGTMTLMEKGKLAVALRKIGRKFHSASDDLADAAASIASSWKIMETFLDDLENGQAERPKAKGGFHISGLRGEKR
jgi:hypothetical protein